jgi:hypothetical protein
LLAGVHDHLARLRKLEVVEVGQLVLRLPAEARTCYGNPCPGVEADPAAAPEYARQAPRLARLTELAEQLSASPAGIGADPAGAEADLAALRALDIVEIGRLLTVAPAPSPYCYNLPCPDDVRRADTENQRRAGVVHDLARATAAEGL